MTVNPYDAAVSLDFAGRRLTFRIDYGALKSLQAEFGVSAYRQRIAAILDTYEIDGLCTVISIATGTTVEEVRSHLPPLGPAAICFTQAWRLAHEGTLELPLEKPVAQPVAGKLTRMMSIISDTLSSRRSAQASTGPTSGA